MAVVSRIDEQEREGMLIGVPRGEAGWGQSTGVDLEVFVLLSGVSDQLRAFGKSLDDSEL